MLMRARRNRACSAKDVEGCHQSRLSSETLRHGCHGIRLATRTGSPPPPNDPGLSPHDLALLSSRPTSTARVPRPSSPRRSRNRGNISLHYQPSRTRHTKNCNGPIVGSSPISHEKRKKGVVVKEGKELVSQGPPRNGVDLARFWALRLAGQRVLSTRHSVPGNRKRSLSKNLDETNPPMLDGRGGGGGCSMVRKVLMSSRHECPVPHGGPASDGGKTQEEKNVKEGTLVERSFLRLGGFTTVLSLRCIFSLELEP